jgi:hypothetical protein
LVRRMNWTRFDARLQARNACSKAFRKFLQVCARGKATVPCRAHAPDAAAMPAGNEPDGSGNAHHHDMKERP